MQFTFIYQYDNTQRGYTAFVSQPQKWTNICRKSLLVSVFCAPSMGCGCRQDSLIEAVLTGTNGMCSGVEEGKIVYAPYALLFLVI